MFCLCNANAPSIRNLHMRADSTRKFSFEARLARLARLQHERQIFVPLPGADVEMAKLGRPGNMVEGEAGPKG